MVKKTKVKWRGIKTTQKKTNESKPKLRINRFNQLTVSLPRIDDKKRWAGSPGLTGISRKLAKIILPLDFDFYIEPFAGMARVFQELIKIKEDHSGIVLNDTSKFVYEFLQEHFENKVMLITNQDFVECFKRWDSKKAFFLIDKPWNKNFYNQEFSSFNRESVKAYDEEILKICKSMEGSFIITNRKENVMMLRSPFNNYLMQSEYVVSGHLPLVLLTTNLNLDNVKGITKV